MMKSFKDLDFQEHARHTGVVYAKQKIGNYVLWAFAMKDSDNGEILGNQKKGTYEVCCLRGKDSFLPLTKEHDVLAVQNSSQINSLMKKMQTKGVKAWAKNLQDARKKFDIAQKRNRLVV
jgi:hypothetical protein